MHQPADLLPPRRPVDENLRRVRVPGSARKRDRYQNYDAFDEVAHQLCAAHLLRDLEDAARSCPGAVWPGQAADALGALIHAANQARQQGLAAVPDDAVAAGLRLFRAVVLIGLQEARRASGANQKQKPGSSWNA